MTVHSAEFTIDLPKTDRSSPLRWIFSHTVRQWPLWLAAFIGAFGNAALAAVTPILTGQAVTAVLHTPPLIEKLLPIAVTIGITQIVRGGLQLARNFGFEVIAQRMERDTRKELYASLLGKSMTFHALQPVGDTMARATNDVREVNLMFSPGFNMVIGSLNFLIMPLILAPSYHPTLILTPVIFTIIYFFALKGYLKKLSTITDWVRAAFGKLNTRLTEALDGIETVKGASQEAQEVELFRREADEVRKAQVKQGDTEARFILMLIFAIALAGGLIHAIILNRMGLIDTGQVVGYFGILLMLDFPTFASIWAYSMISSGFAGARRILELMSRENNLDQNREGFAGEMLGEIEFQGVSLNYGEGGASLKNVNFKVKPGQTVAIVGQTGSGKSSLIKLINRTYDTTEGLVLVDGRDVRDWNLEVLRRGISIIEQDVFLFSRTISENIAFGNPNATPEEIQQAAQAAQANEFIQTFSNGYETVVGERGVTLSGGQRQRVALARAFLTDPRILVLDDSTSAIDSATEDLIQRAIFAAAKGRTTFIITHRLSQIRWADLIIVMRKGEVAAIGAHDELIQTSDAYRRIFNE
jgi:ATP-binding cassette subfamily B protein